jgi:hypothetical protein
MISSCGEALVFADQRSRARDIVQSPAPVVWSSMLRKPQPGPVRRPGRAGNQFVYGRTVIHPERRLVAGPRPKGKSESGKLSETIPTDSLPDAKDMGIRSPRVADKDRCIPYSAV